ncbi:hypothetical protein AMB3_2195 [plant metagenome]
MYTTVNDDAALSRDVIARLGRSWNTRVAVRQERLDLSQYYDPSIPDFPVAMVPFWHDPAIGALDEATRLRLLAAAWVAYNEKAIYLEDEIVQPLCAQLLRGDLPGVGAAGVKQVIAQIQVDEQFHILMCLDICNNARERHALHDYVVPPPKVGRLMKARLAQAASAREAVLLRMAYASVAEMSINAYLNQVSSDQTIQPLNRINTDLHRKDESAHSVAFHEIVGSVYKALGDEDRATFRARLVDAMTDFTTADHGNWASILAYLSVPGREGILARLEEAGKDRRLSRDYTVLSSLFEALGIEDTHGFFSR